MATTYINQPTDEQLWGWAKSKPEFYDIIMQKYQNKEERLEFLKSGYQLVLQKHRIPAPRTKATFRLGTFFPIWNMVRSRNILVPSTSPEVGLSGPESLHLILFLLILTLVNMERQGVKIQMHHPPKISDETLTEHQNLAEKRKQFLFHLKTTTLFPTSSNFSSCLEMATLTNENRELEFLWQDIFCDVPYEKVFEEHQTKIISFYRKLIALKV